jgi:predicted nucleic acid-binding Zn ribbon protein
MSRNRKRARNFMLAVIAMVVISMVLTMIRG